MEENLIIEVWDIFKEYVSEKNREIAANHYIDFLVGHDIELSVLEGLTGYDSFLDRAIELVLADEADEFDEADEDNWDSDAADED